MDQQQLQDKLRVQIKLPSEPEISLVSSYLLQMNKMNRRPEMITLHIKGAIS